MHERDLRQNRLGRCSLAALVLMVGIALPATADVVEFTNGKSIECEVTARTGKSLKIKMSIGGREYRREFPLDRVRAITVDGKREVIAAERESKPSRPMAGSGRSRAEVEALIAKVGRAQPDWWDSVPLKYPRFLDLSWSSPPRGVWNNQRYLGQYVWDVINSNPDKWKGGVRLMHHVLAENQDRPETRQRAMIELGRMYNNLLQDYGRAAFWWRQAGVDKSERASQNAIHLAECYAKLGCKKMALELLAKIPPHFTTIKALADMGEIDGALRLADANLQGPYADIACIYAGDACRVSGQYKKALQYYDKLLALPVSGRMWKRIERNKQRARANVEAIKLFEMLDLARVPDGSYRAGSLGFKGQVNVEVVVKSGRIASVRVTQHHEKQFYSALTDTPRQIVEKQGVKGIDAVSGATITSEAIINATAKALARGMR